MAKCDQIETVTYETLQNEMNKWFSNYPLFYLTPARSSRDFEKMAILDAYFLGFVTIFFPLFSIDL